MKKATALCHALTIILTGLLSYALAAKEITPLTKCGTHGTAKRLNGRTAIVSIFASDSDVHWDFDKAEDVKRHDNAREYLGIAAKWIMEQAESYGVHCELAWDWDEYDCLYVTHEFPEKMILPENPSNTYMEYIDEGIPTDDIMRTVDAENIMYIFFYNTPQSNMQGSYARGSYGVVQENEGVYEYICMFTGEFDQETTPGTYSHEILHLFDVPDMYKANEYYNMSDAFIKAYREEYPRDIMGGAPTDQYDHVQFTFSPLVAYYAGLTNSCDWVDEWGLRKSQYEMYGY